jgi:hypothetical protein
MGERTSKDRLLLDSSYFPLFGIKLEYRNFETIFPVLLEKYDVGYNRFPFAKACRPSRDIISLVCPKSLAAFLQF